MCGSVGAVAERNVVPILLEGLRRLEYRGYDSAGVAFMSADKIDVIRCEGKIANLDQALQGKDVSASSAIGHTRWATHGRPSDENAPPHRPDGIVLVHNGIIENHDQLREQQRGKGFIFTSETDTEVIVHQIHHYMQAGNTTLLEAVQAAIKDLVGAYALAVISIDNPAIMVVARSGSPLVIGVGVAEYFVASDASALLPVTQRFIYLQEGDVAEISSSSLVVYDRFGTRVTRPVKESDQLASAVERGQYKHYMLKAIYEQPMAISETLGGRIAGGHGLEESPGPEAKELLDKM